MDNSHLIEGLRDVKSPIDLPVNPLWIILIVFIVIAALVVIFLNLRKKGLFKKREEVPPPLDPWVIAYQQLDQLKSKDLIGHNEYKQFYFELSDIIRHYFENRFQIHAPEMTTEEFLLSLNKLRILPIDAKENFKKFLISSDMVKFAKYAPMAEEADKSLQLVHKIVDQTKVGKKDVGTDPTSLTT